jgi:hypothetical protein
MDYEISIAAPDVNMGGMTEPPEATYITVKGDPTVAKRVFAAELIETGKAVGGVVQGEAERAATDVLDHDIDEHPFAVTLGQWDCVLTAKVVATA